MSGFVYCGKVWLIPFVIPLAFYYRLKQQLNRLRAGRPIQIRMEGNYGSVGQDLPVLVLLKRGIFYRFAIKHSVRITHLCFEQAGQLQAARVKGSPIPAVGIKSMVVVHCSIEFEHPRGKLPPEFLRNWVIFAVSIALAHAVVHVTWFIW